ncbi:MAG: 3-oxoacyl-ACP reductase FabG [Chloroflexi bacterium]|nr:3-oxoacyl-ACP reductase FabG [Chloroflexota bacterium]
MDLIGESASDAFATGLRGRVGLVTGSSRNIGRAIALAFAQAGADVVVNARTSIAEAEAVAVEARAMGRQAIACLADVRDPEAVEHMVARARVELGPIDLLVNCAAPRPEASFEKMTAEEWHEVLSVILDGAFVCTQAVIGGMLKKGRGTIINIAGMTGQSGAAQRAHVVTAKAGLIGFTKALALELAGRGITVNAVSPGLIDTARVGATAAQPAHRQGRVPPVGRFGRPDEVAAFCCYLASDAARYVTGQTIGVNGGTYIW